MASRLWETDEDDEVELQNVWSAACHCGERIKQLERDNEELILVNKELRKKLICSDATGNLPAVPRLVVQRVRSSPACKVDPWAFLKELPQGILDLPRMHEVRRDLEQTQFAAGHVSFDICKSRLGSAMLDHCEITISSIFSKYPAVFKIGVTQNPVPRWRYYEKDPHDRWAHMTVLLAVPDSLSVGLVEASMIHRFQNTPGNRNVQKGGEGLHPLGEGPYFAYVVFRCLVLPAQR